MKSRIAMVHTVPQLVDTFEGLASELLPDVEVEHVVHEELLQRTIDEGSLSDRTTERLADLVRELRADADLVLVTCSTLGPAVDAIPHPGSPVLRVDTAMARRALEHGARIGVLATLTSTLEPTVQLLERLATDAGRSIEVVSQLCEGAFDAVKRGDGERHDELVRAGLDRLVASEVEVVVLAQASMARVVDSLETAPPVPVLSSPRAAVEQLAELLLQRESGEVGDATSTEPPR